MTNNYKGVEEQETISQTSLTIQNISHSVCRGDENNNIKLVARLSPTVHLASRCAPTPPEWAKLLE